MRKLLYFLITFVGIFLIYMHFDKQKVNYMSIGDGLILGKNPYNMVSYGYNDFVKDYLNKNDRLSFFNVSFYNNKISGLLDDIKNNRTIWDNDKEYFIKKFLRESDMLVISVGMEELFENYDKYNMDSNYVYFNKMYHDIEELIHEIVKYAKGKIIFLGYYNPTSYYDSEVDEFFCYVDIKLNRLMMNNDISYIDLYEKVKGKNYQDGINTPFLNAAGYRKISESIEFYLE